MAQQEKGGLGRGLGALLPRMVTNLPKDPDTSIDAAPEEVTAAAGGSASASGAGVVRELEVGSIRPNPRQPRTVFDDAGLDELAASIREVGVLQPILVRPVPEGGFELVAGERRLRASLRAGRSTVPAIVREADDDTSLLAAFVENVQRIDLNPLEEAAGYRTLIDDLGVTHDDVAKRVGKSRAAVTNALRLLNLAPDVQRRVADGELSAAHARTLAAIADHAQQSAAARRVAGESLSVRATEALVKELAASRTPLTEQAVRTRAARALNKADRPAAVLEAERLLSEWLDTTVRVEHPSSGRGRVVVEYAGIADLTRVVERMTRRP